MKLDRTIALGGAATLMLAGCAAPSSVDNQASAIVNGDLDPGHSYTVGVGGSSRAFCSGTVISRRTVLTAGHCIGGVRNIFLGPRIGGGQATKVAVVEEIQHPMYRDLPNDNATFDLGILKLGADAPVQAVPLFRDTMSNTPRFIGPDLVFSGYGATSGDGGGFGTKRTASFPINVIGPAVVGNTYPAPDNLPAELFYYLDSETMNQGTCSGDSGGPAFFVENGIEQLIGVTSSGDANCRVDGANQRSDQPYIDSFIQPHLDAFEGDDPCRSNGVCDESCNHDGQLGDPDCAAAHCGADGVCAEACTGPADPDCAVPDHCGSDDICDRSCATPDVDCPTPPPPDAATPPTLGPDADTGNGATGDETAGCGCRTGTSAAPLPLALLVLGVLARRRRA